MEKIQDIRIFGGDAGMNVDSDSRFLKENEYREAWNSIVAVSDSSGIGCLQNIKGTSNVFDLPQNSTFTLPSGTLRCNGAVSDIENNAIIFFLCDMTGTNHSIMNYYVHTKVCEWILKGESVLNLKYSSKVSANIVNGLLYWTDGYFKSYLNNDFNPPRKININKAKKYTEVKTRSLYRTYSLISKWSNGSSYCAEYSTPIGVGLHLSPGSEIVCYTMNGDYSGLRHKPTSGYCKVVSIANYGNTTVIRTDKAWTETPNSFTKNGQLMLYEPDMYFGIDWQVLDVVKYRPSEDISASYDDDATQKINKLRNKLFQFRYRHIYDDNEKSVWSKPSEVPLPAIYSNINGTLDDLSTKDNVINVWVDTGPMEATTVEIAVREGNTGIWKLVDRKYKYDEDSNVILASDIYSLYSFYGTDLGEALDQADTERTYDAVPHFSIAQELIEKNRLIYSNYREGYDNIDIDVALTPTTTGVNFGDYELLCNTFTTQEIGWNTKTHLNIPGWGGIINLASIFAPGYSYLISITASPFEYGYGYDDDDDAISVFSSEYSRDVIIGYALVYAPIGTTFTEFSNGICAQLRRGSSSGDSSVIACNTYDYKYWKNTTEIYPYGPGISQSTYWLQSYELGFIMEARSSGFALPSTVAPNVSVNIYRSGVLEYNTGFKSGAIHPCGITYYDRAGRCGAVNTSTESDCYIPLPTGSSSVITQRNIIDWEINHIPPDWADYYNWVYAGNTTESYFLQTVITNIEKLDSNGYLYFEVNRIIDDMCDISKKFNVNPYVWERGDRIRFIAKRDGQDYKYISGFLDFEIIGPVDPRDDVYLKDKEGDFVVDVDGNKVKDTKRQGFTIEDFDYESYGIAANTTIVEIYRPAPGTDRILYHEFGKTYPILNPHTTARLHGGPVNQTTNAPARGSFTQGDVYLYLRFLVDIFPCESAWFSDFFQSNSISIGSPNIEDRTMKNTQYPANMKYGGVKVQQTRINDLSKFLPKDYISLAEKYGSIYSTKEIGYTLHVLQQKKSTSVLIGKAGLKQADFGENDVVAITDNVLGSVVVWGDEYGTVFKSGVVSSGKALYYYDIYSGAIVQWAGNDRKAISDGVIQSFLRTRSRALLLSGITNITTYAAYDELNDMVVFSVIDTATPANSFTIGYHEPTGKWVSFYSYLPEYFGSQGLSLLSFAPDVVGNETLWLHNDGVRMNFYGVQYSQSVKVVSNKDPLKIKNFKSIAVSSNKKWNCGIVGDLNIVQNDAYPRGQQSLIMDGSFVSQEGKFRASMGRNMLTTSAVPSNDDYINGNEMRGEAMEVTLRNASTDETKLFTVEVDSIYSFRG